MKEVAFLPEDPASLEGWRTKQYPDDSEWLVNDSGLEYYSRSAYLNGERDGLVQLLSDTVANKQDAIGMEIAAGSNAVALRELLDSGTLAGALAINLCDTRSEETRQDDRLSHIAGDVTLQETWGEIHGWIEEESPDGLDLILFHPVGGLSGLPEDTYEGAAHHLIDLLKPEGVLFAQAPKPLVAGNPKLGSVCRGIGKRDDIAAIFRSDYSFMEEGLDGDLLRDYRRLRTEYAAIVKA